MIVGAFFALLAAVAGVFEARSILRTARGGADPSTFALRLLGVAGVLVVAALAGAILPAALGWLVGFGASVVWLRVTWRRGKGTP